MVAETTDLSEALSVARGFFARVVSLDGFELAGPRGGVWVDYTSGPCPTYAGMEPYNGYLKADKRENTE